MVPVEANTRQDDTDEFIKAGGHRVIGFRAAEPTLRFRHVVRHPRFESRISNAVLANRSVGFVIAALFLLHLPRFCSAHYTTLDTLIAVKALEQV